MTKPEFIDELAKKMESTKKQAALSFEMVFEVIGELLGKGEQISVPGFGKFSVVKRAARTGVNPRTKKKIKIKATKAPKFSAAKALKEAVKAAPESGK
jgi:nucleoid DNA-binding protein